MNKKADTQVKADKSTAMVIFGATGSLSTSKLFPALIDLFTADLLPETFRIVGVSRQDFNNEEFRKFLQSNVSVFDDLSANKQEAFLSTVQFENGDVTKAKTYEQIYRHLQAVDESCGVCLNKLFYLALPPRFYADVGRQFAESRLMSLCDSENSWIRILVEKPYGTDLETAHGIDDVLCSTFSSDQLFRIDHYLAKQALRNVLTLRFRNQILSGGWNRQYIDHIHVKMYEQNTAADRGGFYDQIGAFRDVGQNHILQLLAATTMEPPAHEDAEAIRSARSKVFSQLELAEDRAKHLKRGQYSGYLEHDAVSDASETETYFRVPVNITADRWQGVPILLESGKGLSEDRVEIEITFKNSPFQFDSVEPTHGNTLMLQFKPNRGIAFDLWTETPQLDDGVVRQTVDFSYAPHKANTSAYAALLQQAMQGDKMMFASNEEVTESWRFTEKVVNTLQQQPLEKYEVGSGGLQENNN